MFAPGVGIAYNTDEADRTSLFVDAEINRRFGNRAYVGTGLGLWDLTHSDFITPTALVHFGLPLWKGDDQKTLFFVTILSGIAALFFESTSRIVVNLRGFFLPWQVMVGTAAAVVVIILVASLASIARVLQLDPAMVFRG